MLIPSAEPVLWNDDTSLSRRVNANSQLYEVIGNLLDKLIKKGEC